MIANLYSKISPPPHQKYSMKNMLGVFSCDGQTTPSIIPPEILYAVRTPDITESGCNQVKVLSTCNFVTPPSGPHDKDAMSLPNITIEHSLGLRVLARLRRLARKSLETSSGNGNVITGTALVSLREEECIRTTENSLGSCFKTPRQTRTSQK